MASTTTFWRLIQGETPAGLFRRVDEGGVPVSFAFLGEHGWVEDPALARWWVDPGDVELVEIDRRTAAGAAPGTDLDGPAA